MALGLPEIILLIGVALLLFGPDKIPELAQALGQATQKYKQGLNQAKSQLFDENNNGMTPEEREIVSAAKEMGIPTQNRTIEEIASDIIAKS